MDVDYYIGKKKVSWDTMTLEEFTTVYRPKGWEDVFEAAEDDIIPEISAKLQTKVAKNVVYPPLPLVFNALESLRPDQVKVVLLGQDPYINENQACGLSFSLPEGVRLPPSIKRIYKELVDEGYTSYKNRKSGDLSVWVDKGVFLYNPILTVDAGKSNSHKTIGWKEFSDMVISVLNSEEHIAWILLGSPAQKYAAKIDKERHRVFKAGHPSPLNRNNDFLGSDVFEEAEAYLRECGVDFTWELN